MPLPWTPPAGTARPGERLAAAPLLAVLYGGDGTSRGNDARPTGRQGRPASFCPNNAPARGGPPAPVPIEGTS